MMTSTSKISLSIMSAVMLLSVVAFPVISLYGGLFPEHYLSFGDVIETVSEVGADAFDSLAVSLMMLLFASSLILFITAICGNKWVVGITGTVSIVILFAIVMEYIDGDFEKLFDFEDGIFGFGFWLAVIMLFSITTDAFAAKEVSAYNEQPNYNQPTNIPYQTPAPAPRFGEMHGFGGQSNAAGICPKCGSEYVAEAVFCENCGHRLKEEGFTPYNIGKSGVCPTCNKHITGDLQFCDNCGTKLK